MTLGRCPLSIFCSRGTLPPSSPSIGQVSEEEKDLKARDADAKKYLSKAMANEHTHDTAKAAHAKNRNTETQDTVPPKP